jgi:hypothetical protein
MNIPPKRLKIAHRAAVAVAFLALGCVLLFSGCRALANWMGRPAADEPDPEFLLDRLTSAGLALRKMDVLDLEGTAGLRSDQRSTYQAKLQGLANDYARKYRDDLIQLARLQRRGVDAALAPRLKAETGSANSKGIAATIELHLRLARAKVPPSQSDVIRDYRNLRYLDPPQS